MTCQEFQNLLDFDGHLVDEEVDVLLIHLEMCHSCGEKYPPMTQLEFEAFVSRLEYKEAQKS